MILMQRKLPLVMQEVHLRVVNVSSVQLELMHMLEMWFAHIVLLVIGHQSTVFPRMLAIL